MSGAVFNYDFGPKRNWRRWVWNRIAERVTDRQRASVLYLPGADDFDRYIAVSKGFRPSNLYAIERDKASLKRLRGSGVLTIDADFFDAVSEFSKRRPIHAVIGDLCCGLSPAHYPELGRWMLARNMRETTFAFNLMRGRDSASNDQRWLANLVAQDDPALETKHRGRILARLSLYYLCVLLKQVGKNRDVGELLIQRSNQVFNEYKSVSGQVFDSLVLTNPLRGLVTDTDFMAVKLDKKRESPSRKTVARSIAAIAAHRTMRACALP